MTTQRPIPPAPADRATTSPSRREVTGAANRTTRRRLLMGIATAGLATGAAGALALPGGTQGAAAGTALSDSLASLTGHAGEDPTFALIAKHRAALMEFCDACEGPGESKDLNNCADDLLVALLTCHPTTVAGAAALLDHVAHPPFNTSAAVSVAAFCLLTTMSLSSARKSEASCEPRPPSSRWNRSCGHVWGIDSRKSARGEKRAVEVAPDARLSSSVPSLRKASFARW
jgi:hypothetical protein